MGGKALIVVDMQEWFFNRELPLFRAGELLRDINALLDAFHSCCLPVLFIRHTNDSYLMREIPDWQLHRALHRSENDLLLDKTARDAFEEPAITGALASRNVTDTVIAGLVTHGCLRAACLGGRSRGFAVTLASNAHSSFDENAEELIDQWNGKLALEGIRVETTESIIKALNLR